MLLVTFTVKLPLKKASFAAFPAVKPVMSTVPEFPGTMVNGQGFVGGVALGLGSASGGGQWLASMVTVTTPAVSVAERITFAEEGAVTSTPRTTAPPDTGPPPGVTTAKCPWGAVAICGYWPVFSVT